jgi:hypothetical protein
MAKVNAAAANPFPVATAPVFVRPSMVVVVK